MEEKNTTSQTTNVTAFEEGFDFSLFSPNTMPAGQEPIGLDTISDPRVGRIVRIVQEAQATPKTWKEGKRKWVEAVAIKNNVSPSAIYRWMKRYEKSGLAGLKHTKSTREEPRAWSPEAVEWWLGLCLKKEHRRIDKKRLYAILLDEARKNSWAVGAYGSALWWFRKRATPQLLALQRGGIRALDNTLPPILRNYIDLEPFEILVGDQHRFDFWVVDDETGRVFRPEGYFWQDLRTRCFYGGAVDTKYDSYLMGLALRMGLKIFGTFDQIYTDWGKPENSKYIMSVLKDMHSVGLQVGKMTDACVNLSDVDGEVCNPYALMPGTHRKAIVRNAKAKMMESTFNVFEEILESVFKVPGHVKDLGGIKEQNEVDQAEIEAFARAGKLLTFYEFAETMFRAMDYYNKDRAHRGVIREWVWQPKPAADQRRPLAATPMDCLRACYSNGWKPVRLSNEAIDVMFLVRATRAIDRGRIILKNEIYEHEALIRLPQGERVELRFDPIDPGWVAVFRDHEYLCLAESVEYSSMKDRDLASRKIEEKARRRNGFILEYRKLTSAVPDFLAYSKVPANERSWFAIEKAAALIGKEQRAKSEELRESSREMTAEELARGVKKLEELAKKPAPRKPLPKRPVYFLTDLDRYTWIVKYRVEGGAPSPEDREFEVQYEASLSEEQREYWETVKELGK